MIDTPAPPAPGVPQLPTPYPPFNQHPQLQFEGLRTALRPALNQVHSDLAHHHMVEFEQAVIVQCVLQVLMSKGLVTREELDAVHATIEQAMSELRAQQITGPKMTDPMTREVEPVGLDCSAHHGSCGAACCASFNVFLTPDEASSAKYLWDIAVPYRLLTGDDGACVYFDRDQLRCSIWQNRPLACRVFDCRDDGRIWDDYGERRLSLPMMETKARIAAALQKGAGVPPVAPHP